MAVGYIANVSKLATKQAISMLRKTFVDHLGYIVEEGVHEITRASFEEWSVKERLS